MNSQYLKKKSLPDKPGVYFFLGRNRKVLYIGKATSLKSRVRSYFASDLFETRGQLIVQMVEEAKSIDFRVTDSVLEAIILEADLIKKFQPFYNTKEKSDTSFNCVVITNEDFPRLLIVRQKDLLKDVKKEYKAVFGPFTQGGMLKDAVKIIRKIFPYRDSKCFPGQGKPCFNRQIGLCPGVCTGEITKTEYARVIRHLILFFSGKKKGLMGSLKREMATAAKLRNFEQAGKIKRTIFALQHIQDVSLIKNSNLKSSGSNFRIEAYDIAHISGTDVVGAFTVLLDGVPQKSEYRKFKIKGGFGNNDVASLKEVVERRFNHPEWSMPNLIVADGGEAQKSAIEDVLRAINLEIPVVAVTKNDQHRPEKILGDDTLTKAHEASILLANNEAHRFTITFHRARRTKGWKI